MGIRREDWQDLKPTVHGWGINDVNYKVRKTKFVDDKPRTSWFCPYYKDWSEMIRRCFYPKCQEKRPTYKGCTVCEEWRYLSNFIKWVDSQPNRDWMNCQLDKDILIENNNCYSPDTCVYIPANLNGFVLNCTGTRGELLLGVSCSGRANKPYQAMCCNPFSKCYESLGRHLTELEAHKAWQAKKHEHACMLADMQEDERVAKALRERYAPDKDWTNK